MTANRKTWFVWSSIILSILFISLLIYAIFLYMDLNEKRTAGFDTTKTQILDQTSITDISSIEKFNGEKSFHVIFGENAEGEEKLIYYPLEGNEKTLTIIDAEEIIPKSSIINSWEKECTSCHLIRVIPALIDEEPLWELTYYNENKRYVFKYISVYDGSTYEEFSYRRMFN
ncbi:cell wall elongation regulator TseB-like domain-containing protein [Oceanobacillus sp. CAU 1775]